MGPPRPRPFADAQGDILGVLCLMPVAWLQFGWLAGYSPDQRWGRERMVVKPRSSQRVS